MSTIEFFDYIFDRYAYLGLFPGASSSEISSHIRQRRAAIHPDKLLRVSQNIMAEAHRERGLVDECARLLLSNELRPMYDQKLSQFQSSAPHLVSVDGVAKLDPSRFRIDLDHLLGSGEQEIEHVQSMAQHMSGMDEKRMAKSRKRFQEHPHDFDARDALRDELTKKLV
jgi:DnaJ-class molecular chaperone